MTVFSQKDDPKAIRYLREGRDRLLSRNRSGAITSFKKAYKLPTTKPLKILLLQQLSECAKGLDDFVEAQEYIEQLCEFDLNFKNAFELMTLYNATNNINKKRAFAEKLTEINAENDDEEKTLINLLLQCEDYDSVLERSREWLKENSDDLEMTKNIFTSYRKQKRIKDAYELMQELIAKGHEEELYYQLAELHNDWYEMDVAMEYMRKHLEKHKNDKSVSMNMKSMMLANASYSGELTDEEYTSFAQQAKDFSKPAKINMNFNINTDYFRRLKVGIVSYDFRGHSVGKFITSLFDIVSDNTGVEIICYYTCPDSVDSFTEAIMERADVFKQVGGYSNGQMRNELLDDNLDILIDLGGQTLGNKLTLLAERFAPIQMSWMGFPISTFTYNIDYQIGDVYLDPIDGPTQRFLTEKGIYRMKPSHMCFALDMSHPIAPEPPCVKNGYITFGNMSNPQKMSGKTLTLWKRTLEKVPGSKLLIRLSAIHSFLPVDRDFFMNKFKERLARYGIDLDRVIFGEKPDLEGYFDSYNDIDIMLDTTPFCAWTTTTESFFMGVPTITLKGAQRQGRGTYAFLANVGLEDLGADDEDDYVQKAYDLANDTDRLKDIKKNLRDSLPKSPLYDTKVFREAFENTLRHAYLDYCFEHKEPFDADSYGDDTDSLFRDCYRTVSIIDYMISEDTSFEKIHLMAKEYRDMMHELIDVLEDKYESQPTVLGLIQMLTKAVSLLAVANDTQSIKNVVKAATQILTKFA